MLLRVSEKVYATFRDDCGFCTEDNQGSSGGRQLQGETSTIHLSLLNVQVLPEYFENSTRIQTVENPLSAKLTLFTK